MTIIALLLMSPLVWVVIHAIIYFVVNKLTGHEPTDAEKETIFILSFIILLALWGVFLLAGGIK